MNCNLTKTRESNMELLRIFAMIGVIFLHFNNSGFGNALGLVEPFGLKFYLLSALEILFICAVNLFIIFTGYYLWQSDRARISRPIKLIIEVIVINILFYVKNVLTHNDTLSAGRILEILLPVNYYVILYSVLYLIHPFINRVFRGIPEEKAKKDILILFLLFSVCPILADIIEILRGRQFNGLNAISMLGDQSGYTIINFMLCYCIGVGLHYLKKRSAYTWAGLFFSCAALDTVFFILSYKYDVRDLATAYCSPIVILMAAFLFLTFKQIRIPHNHVINWLAKGAFTVFLTHFVFFDFIDMEAICNLSPAAMVASLFGWAAIMYLAGMPVYFIYEKCWSFVSGHLSPK